MEVVHGHKAVAHLFCHTVQPDVQELPGAAAASKDVSRAVVWVTAGRALYDAKGKNW